MPRATSYGDTGGSYGSNWWDTAPSAPSAPTTTATIPKAYTGQFSFDVSSPAGLMASGEKNTQSANDFVAGLGEALFGEKTGLVSGIPIVGGPLSAAVRGVSSLPGVGLPAAVGANVLGLGATVLSHIPTGWLPGGTDENFAKLPDTAEKRAVEAAAAADPLNGGNLKYDYIVKAQREQNPTELFPELQTGGAGSLGGILAHTLQVLGMGQRVVERGIAGATIRPGGVDRLGEIQSLKPGDLTPVEAQALELLRQGTPQNKVLDFLAANGSGLAHDQGVEILGSFLTDPAVLAAGVSGIVSKAAKGAAMATEAGTLSEVGAAGRAAYAAQQSSLGPLFKAARTVIDPLSFLGGGSTVGDKIIDGLKETTVASSLEHTYGPLSVLSAKTMADSFGITPQVFNDAIGMGQNIVREHVGSEFVDNLVAAGEQAIAQAATSVPTPAEIDALARNMPKTRYDRLLRRMVNVKEVDVKPDDLARRMAVAYGGAPEDYLDAITKLDDSARSFFHLATYNRVSDTLMETVAKEQMALASDARKLPLERVIVGNPRHIDETQAGVLRQSLHDALKASNGVAAAGQVLRDALRRYDNLSNLIRYNPRDVAGSVERALNKIDELISMEDLPRAVTRKELAAYPDLLAWFDANQPWKIVFRPADDRLWRLHTTTDGKFAGANLWVGHSPASGRVTYRPGYELPRNLVGMPVVGPAAQKAADWIDLGQRAMRQQVSGAVIHTSAKRRFQQLATERYGLSRQEADAIFNAVDEASQADQWASSVRGLSAHDMWDAIGGLARDPDLSLIPLRLRAGQGGRSALTKRDLSIMLLKAWEGDLRYVGLTQKFTGRMKTLGAEFFGGENFMGQLAEKLYPMIRFKFHPMFQAQEWPEALILNAMRGVKPFAWGKMTARDQEIARVADNLVEKGLVHWFDFDMAEFSERAMTGRRVIDTIDAIPNAAKTLTVDGTTGGLKFTARQKRINYLRLWHSQLGSLRKALGEETWLALKQEWKLADDNDVGLRFLSEMTNEAMDFRIKPDGLADHSRLIQNADMWRGSELGALRPLNLDGAAVDMGYTDYASLKNAIDKKRKTVDEVTTYLRDTMHASDDYVRRAKLAMEFDLPQFWSDLRLAYHLTDAEYRSLRQMLDSAARIRGLSTTEYLSGVIAPKIRKVERASLAKTQEMADQVRFLRVAKGVRKNQIDTLYTELARAFVPHLDPSAVETLRRASGIRTRGAWGKAHSEWLGKQMKQYVEGAGVADPDVERALRFMGQWTNEMGKAMEAGSPELRAIMGATAKVPFDGGAPYNYTQQMVWDAVMERVKSLEEDAYRVHYFKRNRTALERSVNHPFFGLYPASYMWGKILPEMIRFVAMEPFGLHTGAMAYTLNDVYNSIAMQRELDPKFDKKINDLGHSPSVFMLSYLLPAVPWDVPSVLPGWARELANQGFANKTRRDRGLPTKNIDVAAAVGKVADYLSPLNADLAKTSNMATEVGNAVLGTPREQAIRGGPQVTIPGVNVKVGGSNDSIVDASELAPVIQTSIDQLTRDLFGGSKF